MADEPTLGEVDRRLAAIHADLKEDFRELGKRLDDKVSMERYLIEQRSRDEAATRLVTKVQSLEDSIAEEKRKAEEEKERLEERRRQDRRWLVTAILMPIALALLQAYFAARGAGQP